MKFLNKFGNIKIVKKMFLLPQMKNLFIVLEGIDNSGKTTLCSRLVKEIPNAIYLSFPDRTTKTGQAINKFLRTMEDKENCQKTCFQGLNFIDGIKVDKEDTVFEICSDKQYSFNGYKEKYGEGVKWESWVIHCLFSANRYEKSSVIKELLKTNTIICDRYWISGAAYSMANGLDKDFCVEIDKELPKPDITFFLNLQPDQIKKRDDFGQEIFENPIFQQKVYDSYMKFRDELTFIKRESIDKMITRIVALTPVL